MNKRAYINPRPRLTIENGGGGQLGNCYYSHGYKVTSLKPLIMEDINALRKAGFLGYGQMFTAVQAFDGSQVTEEIPATLDWRASKNVCPSGYDTVPCVEVDYQGKVVRSPSVNPYTGEEDKPTTVPYYVYLCTDYVDSSD